MGCFFVFFLISIRQKWEGTHMIWQFGIFQMCTVPTVGKLFVAVTLCNLLV